MGKGEVNQTSKGKGKAEGVRLAKIRRIKLTMKNQNSDEEDISEKAISDERQWTLWRSRDKQEDVEQRQGDGVTHYLTAIILILSKIRARAIALNVRVGLLNLKLEV